MTIEEQELRATKTRRIRRVKRWLRPLPRRTNIHRYPVLRYFSAAAKKRAYVWSFRTENAIPAIYIGCVLTLLPIYGIQLPLALVFALLLRANLPILAGLQMVTNPFTVLPIWFALYQVGKSCVSLAGIEAMPLSKEDVSRLIDNFNSGEWSENWDRIMTVFGLTSLGAIIIGIFFGVILSTSYRIAANRTAASYQRLRERIDEHKRKKHPNNS
ncbi:DUF2062 domain-containing protein [Coraliomargarita akajimensis]|uniref:DUF2062 domain-containing protein n=1 Tax=Coraliomargarita akajimensis (strain DSM 45221 / IAM 15411 / JCM 23193 / KCTC 12865 / 04OKA010-24) TaxID=583355 RepID=D5EK04_CORAD|nr:DUF2062 domain-containing protein [Coraliomargarita akajimensis]ADE54753.1 Protein of unknown function DUF2062 [Coraliomargarita akajimensis DSM 45221]